MCVCVCVIMGIRKEKEGREGKEGGFINVGRVNFKRREPYEWCLRQDKKRKKKQKRKTKKKKTKIEIENRLMEEKKRRNRNMFNIDRSFC